MSVKGVTPKCFILALFIRDDGERLLLGDGVYEFAEKQQHFVADKVANTTVDVQGNNGVLLAGQKRTAGTQTFKGYIGSGGVPGQEIEQWRRDFINFFTPTGNERTFYEVVYIMPDGSAIKRQRGFIVNAPEVKELFQIHPEYSVGLTFEDVNYYTYNEDEAGNELYGQSATILLYNAVTGGFQWDANGLVWDDNGAVCNEGVGGTTSLRINSVAQVYPVWTVTGQADNPSLENLTTGQKISYEGRVSVGQTLVIDMLKQTATLNGTNVLPNIKGEWLSFAPGLNRINYITENNNATNSKIGWAEVEM